MSRAAGSYHLLSRIRGATRRRKQARTTRICWLYLSTASAAAVPSRLSRVATSAFDVLLVCLGGQATRLQSQMYTILDGLLIVFFYLFRRPTNFHSVLGRTGRITPYLVGHKLPRQREQLKSLIRETDTEVRRGKALHTFPYFTNKNCKNPTKLHLN